MTKKPPDVPPYRLHKSTGSSYAVFNGKRTYFGRHGRPESKAKYDQAVAEWLAGGRQVRVKPSELTIVELADRFNAHADRYYVGPDGKPTNEPHNIRTALKPLLALYGETPATEFGPLAIKAVRERMIGLGWVRSSVNKHISRIKRMYRWASENEVLPATAYHAVACVAGLRYGRSEAKESEPIRPVADGTVDATIRHMTKTTAAMVQFQRLTGARAGEVCILRSGDLDTTGKVWTYTPSRHKTQHFGRPRVIFVGPKAQEILKPFLRTDLQAYVFSPAKADRERRDRQHAERVTPLSCGNKPGSNVKRSPKKTPGDRYEVNAYNRAIANACRKAFAAPDGLSDEKRKEWDLAHHWSSHQLRHSFATDVRKNHGLEAAQVTLGHASANITEVYAERDVAKAIGVVLKIG